MARDRANLRTDMIGDDDYRQLTRDEQWLYKTLLIHPTLSYAGVADWRPGRLASIAAGTTSSGESAGICFRADDQQRPVGWRCHVESG